MNICYLSPYVKSLYKFPYNEIDLFGLTQSWNFKWSLVKNGQPLEEFNCKTNFDYISVTGTDGLDIDMLSMKTGIEILKIIPSKNSVIPIIEKNIHIPKIIYIDSYYLDYHKNYHKKHHMVSLLILNVFGNTCVFRDYYTKKDNEEFYESKISKDDLVKYIIIGKNQFTSDEKSIELIFFNKKTDNKLKNSFKESIIMNAKNMLYSNNKNIGINGISYFCEFIQELDYYAPCQSSLKKIYKIIFEHLCGSSGTVKTREIMSEYAKVHLSDNILISNMFHSLSLKWNYLAFMFFKKSRKLDSIKTTDIVKKILEIAKKEEEIARLLITGEVYE